MKKYFSILIICVFMIISHFVFAQNITGITGYSDGVGVSNGKWAGQSLTAC